jgi:hypothetical protein
VPLDAAGSKFSSGIRLVRSEVVTRATVKITVFRDMTPCSEV